jgi:hypothetical protein
MKDARQGTVLRVFLFVPFFIEVGLAFSPGGIVFRSSRVILASLGTWKIHCFASSFSRYSR